MLSGVDAEVALIQQATTTIIVDGASLTLNGTANAAQILGSVEVKNGGSLTIAVDAEVYAGGTVKLGNPGNGTLTVDGLLRSFTGTLSITDEPSGGGLVTISPAGSLVYDPFNTGVIRARLENDGTVALTQAGGSSPSQLFAYPSAGSPASDGAFTVSGLSTLALRPTRDSTMTVAGSITGSGRLEINESTGPSGTGTVLIPDDDALSIGRLTIGAPSALDLGGSGTAAELLMSEGGGRLGAGTLTAGTASLDGSQISGGVTKVSGAATIDGGASAATIRGGAKLRTEGATAWSGGAVLLGAFSEGGTWENAGTLTVDNSGAGPGDPPLQLVAGSATGVLRNLAGATVQRGAPAGTMFGTGRIENAGTINVTAGTMGSPAAAEAGQLVQSGGLTTVSQGAVLSMDVTLNGGTLRGSGTVRQLSNSAGTVEPGASPGTLTVTNDFTQGPGGTLREEIAGIADASFDRLVVGGLATVGGTLAIDSDPGFTPPPSSTYRFVESGSRAGAFQSLTGAQVGGSAYLVNHQADGVRLCFAACPGPTPSHSLTAAISGAGTGTVTSDIGGLACQPTCTQSYPADSVVTLTPTPSGGSTFIGWGGDCEGVGACVLTMSGPRSITATFAPPPPPPPSPPAPPPAAPTAPAPLSVAPPTKAPAKKASRKRLPKVRASRAISLVSARRCLTPRRFRVRLRMPRGVRATRARVKIKGKQVKVVRGKGLKKAIRLRTLPRKGRFRVEVRVSLADKRTIRRSRTYRACRTKRR